LPGTAEILIACDPELGVLKVTPANFRILAVLACLLLAPYPVLAQQRAARIGYLDVGSADRHFVEAFKEGLKERGWVEGQNLSIEYRSAETHLERLPALASELVNLKVDLIFAPSPPAALAAKKASSTIPIVFATASDPVAYGLVASLARPGSNVTGIAINSDQLSPKRLEIFKEAFPKMTRAAVLFDANNYEACEIELKAVENAANRLGITLQQVGVASPEELPRAFSTISQARAQAVFLPNSPVPNVQRKQIAEWAAANQLPIMYEWRELLEEGSLVAYGPSFEDSYRRAAAYVDRILRGAKPSTLPVEQPSRFELVVNLKAAKALGLTIPQLLLLRADRVIE
jgi:putative ABC transport system substrate-binding protein